MHCSMLLSFMLVNRSASLVGFVATVPSVGTTFWRGSRRENSSLDGKVVRLDAGVDTILTRAICNYDDGEGLVFTDV
jgi:hypothetical protein